MTEVELRRQVAADPASMALLLADLGQTPEQVPGQRRDSIAVTVPHRSGVSFTASVEVHADGRDVRGALVVRPAADPGSEVELNVESCPDDVARRVSRLADRYLDDLVERAQSRAFAA